jgi:hypothetical protein
MEEFAVPPQTTLSEPVPVMWKQDRRRLPVGTKPDLLQSILSKHMTPKVTPGTPEGSTTSCRLAETGLLRKAWHIARTETVQDSMEDPYHLADFASELKERIGDISARLKREPGWAPAPQRRIDMPKSNLAVRPIALARMEDRIIMNAILLLLAPELAGQQGMGVYSLRKRSAKRRLPAPWARRLLMFPFLKGRTVRRHLLDTEPWYVAWPAFIAEVRRLATSEYPFMVTTDIAAYFENIDLHLLRAMVRRRVSSANAGLVDCMCDILETWELPPAHATQTRRGIPQGDDTSRLLGNVYLFHLDDAFESHELVKSGRVRYLRYMDDVKLMARTGADAVKALHFANTVLRELRLNAQGAKTRLLDSREKILAEVADERLDRVNKIAEEVRALGNNGITPAARRRFLRRLNAEAAGITNWMPRRKATRARHGWPTIPDGRDMRLYSRILTAKMPLKDGSEVRCLLHQIRDNQDAKVLLRAMRYFENVPDNKGVVTGTMVSWLSGEHPGWFLFPYTRANFLRILRHSKRLPAEAFELASRILADRSDDSYVRQQAAQLLARSEVDPARRSAWEDLLKSECDPFLRRALMGLCVPDEQTAAKSFLDKFRDDRDADVRRTGRYLTRLAQNREFARSTVESLAWSKSPHLRLDRQMELRVVALAGHWPAVVKYDSRNQCFDVVARAVGPRRVSGVDRSIRVI